MQSETETTLTRKVRERYSKIQPFLPDNGAEKAVANFGWRRGGSLGDRQTSVVDTGF
jgi:hypothetical protein